MLPVGGVRAVIPWRGRRTNVMAGKKQIHPARFVFCLTWCRLELSTNFAGHAFAYTFLTPTDDFNRMSEEQPTSPYVDLGVASFMGSEVVDPYADDLEAFDSGVGIVGFPFDSTCISRTGANQGPRAIRDASSYAMDYHFEYDLALSEHYSMIDCGDVPVIPGNAKKSIDRGEQLLSKLFSADILPVMLGGDHAVTIAGTQALGQQADDPALINIDTHIDVTDEVAGERYNHCCPLARSMDEAGFDPERMAVIGLSSFNFQPDVHRAKELGINLFTLDDIIQRGAETVTREAMDRLDGADALYLTIDIDVLDAGIAPGTGVPTPGGMNSRELLQILGVIASEGIDAMDVVEVSPQLDSAGITSRIATRSIVDCLAANAIGEANGIGTGTRGSELVN